MPPPSVSKTPPSPPKNDKSTSTSSREERRLSGYSCKVSEVSLSLLDVPLFVHHNLPALTNGDACPFLYNRMNTFVRSRYH